ncbi:right-handed parallel beta-helix repeat-containing protein [Streptomyces sp. NPDC020917]|uniref:right-handed parallel beta-helix repeat-containing protein n=1 Tax=Streptomyces sp. NPDC020917 TaxID=3365102 RepID=UPI0037B04EA8
MAPAQDQGLFSRRRALAGLGAVGAVGATAAAGVLAVERPAGAVTAAGGLPVLQVGEDWAAALAAHPRVQLVPGATYTLDGPVELPDGCLIAGNGATVTVADATGGALRVTGRSGVTLSNLVLLGQPASPLGTAQVASHVGLAVSRSTDVRVDNCDFTYWRGAGVTVNGSPADDYFAYRVKLQGNAFHACYFGVSMADRSEYSMFTGNSLSYCRLAIWNSSGNWTVNDNSVVGCYGAYYSFAATSPYGSLTADNWSHGSLVGNTFNHSGGGARQLWSAGAAFAIGGTPQDPGSGVVVDGVLPPTFTGNTLWYSDVHGTDLLGTRWLLSGCTLSNLTVTGTGGVPVELVGTQSNGTANAPVLKGNARDLLAALY